MNKENSKPKILKYQTRAIDFALEFLSENSVFNLQSPTGSGKTFIIANLIDKYLENSNLNSKQTTFVFVAPSSGKLDRQGYEKLSWYLTKGWVKGYSANYIGTSNNKTQNKSYLQNIDYFKPNNVYFFGWSMFKDGTRIVEIDSERNNIYRVIKNTHDNNINIVLIIDEAHLNYDNKDNKVKDAIIRALNPHKTIRISATLDQVNKDVDYRISYDDVIEECAIKKNIEINGVNSCINNIWNYDENEQLILSAIEKQKEVKAEYIKKNINIKPLIIIQIPDKISIESGFNSEEYLLDKITSFLEKNNYKKGITFSMWLDKIKPNSKEKIVDNNSTIEILIFKQAIAIGWDVPRANMLVRIREPKSSSFNIQTLGRILRNPFFKFYDNNLIDNAFVFTRDDKYKDYIKQESICIDNDAKAIVKRSKKSKDSNLSIDKVLIDSNISDEQLIEFVSNDVINHNNFLNFFEYNTSIIDVENITISSKDVLDNQNSVDILNKEISNQKQMQFKFINSKESLLDLYIKFKTITKSNNLVSSILESISLKINRFNKKIKEFYLACINNWNSSIFKSSNNRFTLLEKINELINNYQIKNIEYKKEKFNLPKEYSISSEIFWIDNWDKVNTYNIKLKNWEKTFDSNIEKEFYKIWTYIFSDINEIHIFRNGTSNEDYFINYIDEFNKTRKFYPDFIVVNEIKKTVFILEAKGRNEKDIDKNTNQKINSFKNILCKKLIKSDTSYDIVSIFKVTLLNDDIEIIDEKNDKVFDIYEFKELILK